MVTSCLCYAHESCSETFSEKFDLMSDNYLHLFVVTLLKVIAYMKRPYLFGPLRTLNQRKILPKESVRPLLYRPQALHLTSRSPLGLPTFYFWLQPQGQICLWFRVFTLEEMLSIKYHQLLLMVRHVAINQGSSPFNILCL